MGACDENGEHCDLLEGLSPGMKRMFFAMAETAVEQINENNLDKPNI
ncbi:hypothetical protein IMCC1989_1146 [gamma proteobacterium IMCC1989]|nr:hypothetical protein IMCC1989_1146 [gamma proteobacterium IMCC1989]